MNFIDRLEKRFPGFGVTGLMKYVTIINIVGAAIGLLEMGIGRSIYLDFLSLDFYQITHGQVWRLVTFLIYPSYELIGTAGSVVINLLWFALMLYINYFFGTALERAWGKFRFSLFYFGGAFLVVLITLGFYIINISMYGSESAEYIGYMISGGATLTYLNETLFLAYALTYAESFVMLYFVIPIKAKWMALITLILMGYHTIRFLVNGTYYGVALIVGALVHVSLFLVFGRGRSTMRADHRRRKRKEEYIKRTRPKEMNPGGARHRCAICGRSEADDPRLEFRFCSKCNGNYEYCSDHLFSHEHVR